PPALPSFPTRRSSDLIRRVLPWLKRLRFGLPRDDRPAGVFLFLGPTGAGKTQMAKELARYVYGSEEMIIFLEMGQFKTKEAMNRSEEHTSELQSRFDL